MKKIIKFLIKSIGIFILVFILLRTDWPKIFSILRGVNYYYFLTVILIIIPKDIVQGYKWHTLVEYFNIGRKRYMANIKLFYSGILLGIVSPGRVGELYILTRLDKKKYAKTKGMFVLLFSRICDVAFIVVLGLVSLIVIRYKMDIVQLNWAIYLLIGGILVFLVSFKILKEKIIQLVSFGFKKIFKTDITYKQLRDGLNNIEKRVLLKVAAITIVYWLIHFTQIYLIAVLLKMHIAYFDFLLVSATVSFVAAIPITIMGIGTREFAYIKILALYNVPESKSLAVSLLSYCVFFSNALIGAIFWTFEHRVSKSTKKDSNYE